MTGKKVTSSDVAKRAGVSQATVSMVLNKKYNVSFSKDVVRKVEEAAEELGYVLPKRRARKEEHREKLLVIISPNLTNPYYVMLLQGIESRAAEQGFGIFVCNTQRDLSLEERYLKMIPALNPHGIIYMCNPGQCFMERVESMSKKIPVVVINNQNEKLNVDALYDEKYRVPGDMSVMGCDNTLFAKVKKVSLTTIEHFVIYKGMDACDIIMKKIGSRTKKYTEIEPVSIYHVEYEPKVVVRGTTSYPRTEIQKKGRQKKV